MRIHLVDGTYELFRAYYAMPPMTSTDGRPVGAVVGLIQTLLALLRLEAVSHIGCAFDHVIESFRNELFAGYKTGQGIPEELMGQFGLAERAVSSLGIVVWPMVEFEADDAIATAADRWWEAPGVAQVVICSPDKDFTQMVRGRKVVCLDRQKNVTLDEAAVVQKFGVGPESIPDYLALVGDSADGIPGVPRWGAKTTAQVLQRYGHLERIPDRAPEWDIELRGAEGVAASLSEHRAKALLYKTLATFRTDVPLTETLLDLEWQGVPGERFIALCEEIGHSRLARLPHKWKDR